MTDERPDLEQRLRGSSVSEATNPLDLSIITVSFNTCSVIHECVRSVRAHTTETSFEHLIVDNASTDNSVDSLRSAFSDLLILPQSVNLGFGRAVNLAAQSARGRYILLLNPDTVILDHAIDRLVAFADQHPEARIYGGYTVFSDESPNTSSGWNRPTLWSELSRGLGLTALFPASRHFDPERISGRAWGRTQPVDIVSGCFLLVRKTLWDRLGGFDPGFFVYGEDVDLCIRAAQFGARPLLCGEARVVHHGAGSEPVLADKLVRLLRAKGQLYRRHWHRGTARLGSLTLVLWALTRWLGYGALACFGLQRAREPARVWAEVLRRRSEWLRA